jgi:hypothetical protein
MAKDPAFLFYPGDWQGGTSTLSRFLKGCYMDVLIAQFNSGHLSLEEIKTVLGSDFGQAWPTIQKKFTQDQNGLFYNVKLETEMIKRKEYSASRSKNRSSKKDMNNICKTHVTHMSQHMENGNIYVFNISKELCKIFGKEYQLPQERMPAMANYYRDIDFQAEAILKVLKPDEAAKQITSYIKYCDVTKRKRIGLTYKLSETLLSSDWVKLLSEYLHSSTVKQEATVQAINELRSDRDDLKRQHQMQQDMDLLTPEAFKQKYGDIRTIRTAM